MKRLLVISDIHGCLDPFLRLLDQVGYRPGEDRLVLGGDYVDRGPHSKEVVAHVMHLAQHPEVVVLKGNHDARFAEIVATRDERVKENFLRYGGVETLESYTGAPYVDSSYQDILGRIAAEHSDHIAFLAGLPLFHEDEDHIFVHAGLNPAYEDWKTQAERDFLYIRGDFHRTQRRYGRKVIFGHTVTKEFQHSAGLWFDGEKIGIDGGCAYGLQLNCLIVREGEYEQAACSCAD